MTIVNSRLVLTADANNPTVGDRYLNEQGHTETVEGLEAIAQIVFVRLYFMFGEWVHDQRQGVPYRSLFFEKGTDDATKRAILVEVIEGSPGIAAAESVVLERNATTRLLEVTFTARTVDGQVLRSSDFGPVLVDSNRRRVALAS